jgi:hypothetical protein
VTHETSSYGWQTLAVDGSSLAVAVLTGVSHSSPDLFVVSLAGYVVGAPIVHGAHRRSGTAGADLALRLGAPLVGGLVGAGVAEATLPQCQGCFRGVGVAAVAALGAAVGMLTASIVDATCFAREPLQRDEPKTSRAAVNWSPSIAVTPKGGASAGVSGTF